MLPMSTPVRREGARHVLGRPRQLSETRLDGRYACRVQPAGSRTTLSSVAAAAGVSLATVSKVVNDRHDVAPATRRAGAPAARAAQLQPARPPPRPVPHGRTGHAGPRQRVGGRDHPRRHRLRARRRRLDHACWCRRGDLGRGRRRVRAGRRHRGHLAVHLGAEEGLPAGRHSLRGHRPGRPARPGRAQRRRDQLGRRAGRHPPPGPARAPADRGDRRTGRRAVRAGADRRLPRRAGRGRPAVRPRAGPGGHLPARRRVRRGERAARACPTGRPRSSPAATSRRSA